MELKETELAEVELRQSLYKLLIEFNKKTGLFVTDIDIDYVSIYNPNINDIGLGIYNKIEFIHQIKKLQEK